MKQKVYLAGLRSLAFIVLTILISGLMSCSQQPTSTEPVKDFVFGEERGFQQCHASTLVQLKDGSYLIAWFGGTKESHDDVGIWMSRGIPGQWTAPVELAKIREDAHWNPVLFRSPEGRIYLYFKVGKTIPAWETWVVTSDDEGETWSEAYELVPGDKGGRGPVRNKPVVLSDGTWLAGASFEDDDKKLWDAFADRSEDGGKTWTATPYLTIDRTSIEGRGIIQPTLWESAPGKVHMLLRSSGGMICRSDSEDYGKTWSPVYATDLPNPNSGIDLVRLDDGTLVLLYNPDNKNWGSRGKLNLAVSYDNGITWPNIIPLEDADEDDEYSYPAIITDGKTVAYTYTWMRDRIVFGTATGLSE